MVGGPSADEVRRCTLRGLVKLRMWSTISDETLRTNPNVGVNYCDCVAYNYPILHVSMTVGDLPAHIRKEFRPICTEAQYDHFLDRWLSEADIGHFRDMGYIL